MTDDRMTLMKLVETSADEVLVRGMHACAAERLMGMKVEAATGAPKGTRTPARTTQRNGYRERGWETRAGPGQARSERRRLTCKIPHAAS